jgi:hypothetical protein
VINFKTENIIIVAFPTGAGGKFLINCLGLSNGSVMQDAELISRQLNQSLISNDKFNILQQRIFSIRRRWNDLDFGYLYTGTVIEDYRDYYKNNDFSIFKFNPDLEQVINTDKLFFYEAHDVSDINILLKVWPNAKIILFKNCLNFILDRQARSDAREAWQGIISNAESPEKWPEHAPLTYNELDQCSDYVKNQLTTTFKNAKYHERLVDDIEKYKSSNETYYWDTDLYFSTEKTTMAVKELYDCLGLIDFNPEHIAEYHKLWINKLNELKNLNEKTFNHHGPAGVR